MRNGYGGAVGRGDQLRCRIDSRVSGKPNPCNDRSRHDGPQPLNSEALMIHHGKFSLFVFTAFVFMPVLAACPAPAAGISWRQALPRIPHRTFNITRYGAAPNASQPATAAIARALKACGHAGGGTVVIPKGTFISGPIRLHSGTNLHLNHGAVLLMQSYGRYPESQGRYADFISADGAHDIAITGHGTINGRGAAWWAAYRRRPDGTIPQLPHRPQMIAMNNVHRLLIRNVRLVNPANTHISIRNACKHVTIRGILIHAPRYSPNTDGMDICGRDILITHCRISDGDDCIAIGSGGRSQRHHFQCRHIVISHCIFGYGHGLSIGSFTRGGIADVLVNHCTFHNTTAGIRLKSNQGRGGRVENLTYENLTMHHVRWPVFISSYYPHAPKQPWLNRTQTMNQFTPRWNNIRIINFVAHGSKVAARIIGLAQAPIRNLVLQNVRITSLTGMTIIDAANVRIIHCTIAAVRGKPLIIHHATITVTDLQK